MLKQLPNADAVTRADLEVISEILHGDKSDFRPNNIQAIVLGTFILWICWLFFNAGSTGKMA